ncbi:isoleucyl-tRNA synthetase [Brevipalpus obovatus]|uniref:isoleucyl-tRNA synthetase n=1 Tax=Brevipalpus obovatus TaxID=246614 RepID=UPI003D9F9494
MSQKVQTVPESIRFPDEEEKTLKYWDKIKAFETSLRQSAGKEPFIFYDGPPFATGKPHYGHILAGTIKDIVTRWAHQSGFHVERRFGWDCHGLPVEYEIDKQFKIKGPEDVMKMGVAKYNAECRAIVMKYSNEWRQVVNRLGRWIDFDNDYKTLYPWFMESVWWAFQSLHLKGFVYKGVKVMPYSTACSTPLSNFESGQNYKEVVDPCVIVSFPLEEDPSVSLLAWTTTPWTLPSNLGLCVNPNEMYVKIEDETRKAIYILMEARLTELYKKPGGYKILEKFEGKTLEGKKYIPLFKYFENLKSEGAFRVLCDNYVTTESGVGIVHQAPYFGEDDHRVCLANGVIKKESTMVCPIDESGRFVEPVTDFLGQHVKDADKEIIKHLKSNGRLVHQSTVKHNYPFCWRSETPLIYRAVPSWFIRVEQMNDLLLKNNQETYWVPDFVKEKRFANWLRDARDWAVSRNRYWGTPIPIWQSDDGEEIVVIGSIAELERLSGKKVTDLHRESVDSICIPSQTGRGQLKRIPEVFDCWFESGSMPYAQAHYPFENKEKFERAFPAHFIAEGVDQTRGWFYTLLVLSTALFNKPPFKNLIVNGLVLASDGQKMSKSKKNYPDPMEILKEYGSDALRLYLINSPVVRAENLKFREEGVRDVLREVLLPWYNAYRFLVQNVQLYEKNHSEEVRFDLSAMIKPENLMDRWILSFTQSLIKFVRQEMDAYRLYTVVPRLLGFIENLTNWYVKMNRKRLKGDISKEDTFSALRTLATVLMTIVKLMAPFTPFLTEHIYGNLRRLFDDDFHYSSIHHLMLPDILLMYIDEDVEMKVATMKTVVDTGRLLRERETLPLKYPIPEIVVISKDETVLDDARSMERYIKEELNVRRVTITGDKDSFGLELTAEPDTKALGIRLRDKSKEIIKAIRELSSEQIQEYQNSPNIFSVNGVGLREGEIRVNYRFGGDSGNELATKYVAASEGNVLVLLDKTPDAEMRAEGLAREVINRVQKTRKEAGLLPTNEIEIYYQTDDSELSQIIVEHKEFLKNGLNANVEPLDKLKKGISVHITKEFDIKSKKLTISIVKIKSDKSKR